MPDVLNVATKTTGDRVYKNALDVLGLAQSLANSFPTLRYGVKISKTESDPSTRCTYILDAVGMTPAAMNFTTGEFDYGNWSNVWFVKGNYPCMLTSEGAEDYKLDPDDYSKKEDGTASDYNDLTYDGNAMARIPLVYLYLYEDEDYHYFIVSNKKYDNNYKRYAHTDASGDVVDRIYLGIYEGYVDSNNKLRSISTGQIPTGGNTMADEMTYAQANGDGWDVRSWAQRVLLNVELTLMGKSTNSQAVYGLGNVNNSAWEEQYCVPNGLGNTKGQFWGENVGTKAGNAVLKTFHIENWWGNKWERITGLLQGGNVGKGFRVKMTPPYNVTGSEYTLVLPAVSDWANNEGFIGDGATSTDYGFVPYMVGTASSSDSTYWSDYNWQYAKERYNQSYVCGLCVGMHCFSEGRAGAWAFYLAYAVSHASWDIGASLSFIPQSLLIE